MDGRKENRKREARQRGNEAEEGRKEEAKELMKEGRERAE